MAGVGFIVLATWLLLLSIYYLWSRRRYYRVAWQLPGPLGLPFIGVGLNMRNPETFLQFMEVRSKQYTSPFISWMGTNCFLFVNDPETVETIFNSPQCTNKGALYRFMSSAIGDGLFTSSSLRWNKHRRLINPAFSRQIVNNFLPIFNAEADVLLRKLASAAAEPQAKLEIYELLKRSVLEAACQTTMGKRMHFQEQGSRNIFDAYNGVTEVCVRRMLSPWLYPDIIYQRSALFAHQQRVVQVLFNFVESLLQRINTTVDASSQSSVTSTTANLPNVDTELNNTANDTNDTTQFKDTDTDTTARIRKSKSIFIEQVRTHVEQGQLSWEDVRDEANVMIAATFETTSTGLYLVCLCLAMHPEYQEKLHHELVEIFPDADTSNFQVTNAELERMTYMDMIINEALRLHAPVPMVLRAVSDDFRLRNGVLVPRGTQVGIDIYNMQRNEHIWGPHAKQFRPELHFGAAATMPHPFAFIPFTKGLRMCIGYRYALMLMKVFIAKIFRNYRISTTARPEDLVVKGTISLKLRDYPLCRVERRT